MKTLLLGEMMYADDSFAIVWWARGSWRVQGHDSVSGGI